MSTNEDSGLDFKSLFKKLDELADIYGSSDVVLYDQYKGLKSKDRGYVKNAIGSTNTKFDNAPDTEKDAVINLLEEIYTLDMQKINKEGGTIALRYGDEDFGVLTLEQAHKSVYVTVTHEGDIVIPKRKEKIGFQYQDMTCNKLFKHLKLALEPQEYNEFITQIQTQIEEVTKDQSDSEAGTPIEDEKISDTTRLEGEVLLADPEMLVTLNKDMDKRIRHDMPLRNVVLLVGESAYGQNPLNLFLQGPSSSGKTYVVTETLKYFPTKDVWILGGLSPTALMHDYGSIEEINGVEFKVVDLSRKILVFLEKPNMATIRQLLPIMSHDKDEIEYRITDKNEIGQHVTMKAVIRGFPAFIFCTTETEILKELSTRNLLYAPEITEEKTTAVLKMQKDAATQPLAQSGEENDLILQAQAAIHVLSEDFYNAEVALPPVEMLNMKSSADPRVMRDNKKRLEMIKTCARLHAYQRVCLIQKVDGEERRVILANFFDVLTGLTLFEEIALSTTTGLAPVIISFFNKILKSLGANAGCFSYDEMAEKYFEVYNQPIGRDTLRKLRVDPLEQAGYVTSNYEEGDRRKKLFRVVRDIPTFQSTGQNRRIELSGISVSEMAKAWLYESNNIADVLGYVYRGTLFLLNSKDPTSLDEIEREYVLMNASMDPLFLKLFPALKTATDDRNTGYLKNPGLSGNFEDSSDECIGIQTDSGNTHNDITPKAFDSNFQAQQDNEVTRKRDSELQEAASNE